MYIRVTCDSLLIYTRYVTSQLKLLTCRNWLECCSFVSWPFKETCPTNKRSLNARWRSVDPWPTGGSTLTSSPVYKPIFLRHTNKQSTVAWNYDVLSMLAQRLAETNATSIPLSSIILEDRSKKHNFRRRKFFLQSRYSLMYSKREAELVATQLRHTVRQPLLADSCIELTQWWRLAPWTTRFETPRGMKVSPLLGCSPNISCSQTGLLIERF